MKIAILSRNAKLYSTRRLKEAAEERGHEIQIIDVLRAYMNIASHHPTIHYKGEPVEGVDAVIPRIGASVTFYGAAVLRQFEMMGVYPLNESVAITRSRDKLRSLQLLARRGIGLPVTGFASKPDDIKDMIKMVGGAPLVVKLLEGTQGIGVVLAETQKAAESVIEGFMGVKANILVQEYIKEAEGADIRCLVIGGKSGCIDAAQSGARRISLKPSPRRNLVTDQNHAGRTLHGRARSPNHGAQCGGGRPIALQPRPRRHGSKLQPRP